jgi:hypothetical protein
MEDFLTCPEALKAYPRLRRTGFLKDLHAGKVPYSSREDRQIVVSRSYIERYIQEAPIVPVADPDVEKTTNLLLSSLLVTTIPEAPTTFTYVRKPRSMIARLGRDKRNWVYYIQAEEGGPVKIGKTLQMYSRLQSLQGMSPQKLRLLAVEPNFLEIGGDTESLRHKRFEKNRLHGEWFTPTQDMLDFLNTECLVVNRSLSDLLRDIKLWRQDRDEVNDRRKKKKEEIA